VSAARIVSVAGARVTPLLLLVLVAPAPRAGRPEGRLQKFAQILSFEDRRSAGQGQLLRYLGDPDRGVRRRAALAAGRIGDRTAVVPLIELMNDPDPELRRVAAFALGLIGDRTGSDRLVASLQDQDAAVRGRSAEALGRIGDPARAKDVAAMVAAALPKDAPLVTVRGDDAGSANDPWLELRLGLFALARLKDAAVAEAVLLPGGRPRFDWWAATWAAMRIATPNLRPLLLAATASSDGQSRALAARGLGALKDSSALDTLVRLAQDREPDVVVQALRALGGLQDARGTGAVLAALGSPNLELKLEALRALQQLPSDPSLRARVVPYVGHELAWIRAAALGALARVDREDFAMVLSGMDLDPDWMVRAGLATALGEVGDESSLSLLFAMLKDEDIRVLPAVLTALKKARGTDAAPTLRQFLERPEPSVRAAAAENLRTLKIAGVSEALAAAYRRALPDVEIEARLAAVDALAAEKDEPAQRALVEAAEQDPLRALRARAAAALRAAGQQARDVGAESSPRVGVDLRDAMLPYEPQPERRLFTPRAILLTRKGRIEIHLNVIDTPLTTQAFIALARRGFYDGLSFHRVVAGFVVQGGCPRGDGSGGPGYTLRSELSEQPFGRGSVGMADAGPDTAGSQFFVTRAAAPQLDGAYTLFGRVASGMEVVDQLRPGDVIERVEIWDGR
jgi:cyclophilin family peptidyl-prolyl cis-trans isomerase/HEAT repeat protein